MDSWKRFDETLLPDKEYFQRNLNMNDIIDDDYKYENKYQKTMK